MGQGSQNWRFRKGKLRPRWESHISQNGSFISVVTIGMLCFQCPEHHQLWGMPDYWLPSNEIVGEVFMNWALFRSK